MDKSNTHIDNNSKAQYIDWLRGQGDKPDEVVIEHVASCYQCKEEILELSEILDKEDRFMDHRWLRKSKSQLLIRAAAVLVGVIVVALAIEFLKPDKRPIQIVHDDTDTVQLTPADSAFNTKDAIFQEAKDDSPVIKIIQHDTIKYAANFEPNQGLEVLINAHFRSKTVKGESYKEKRQVVYHSGDKFIFDLGRFVNSKVVLSIVDHSGSKIAQIESDGNSNNIVLDWKPGLYYWKLSTSEELLELGKFRLYSQGN